MNAAGIILDVILALILIKVVYDCYSRGFLASIIKVAGVAASFILASMFSTPVSAWIYDRFLQTRVVDAIAQRLPESVGNASLAGLSGFMDLMSLKDTVARMIGEGLGTLAPVAEFFSGGDSGATAEAVINGFQEGRTVAEAIAEAAVRPAVIAILGIAVFFVLFTVVMFLVRVLVRMGRGVNHIPLVGGVNRLAGLALGVVYAALLGYIIALGLALVAGISAGKIPFLTTEIISETQLIHWLVSLKLR